MSWTPDIPKPDNYVEFSNGSGITFYLPTDAAPANVPYSFEVFASSIDKNQIIDPDGNFVKADGSVPMTGNFDVNSRDIVGAGDVNAFKVRSDFANVSGVVTAGRVVVSLAVAPDTAAGRNITHSLTEPTSSDGNNGDIWFTYKDE